MQEEGKNILKYSPGDKSLKVTFIIYADLECLLKKEQPCQNNPKNSYTQRKAKEKTDANFIEEKIVSKRFEMI